MIEPNRARGVIGMALVLPPALKYSEPRGQQIVVPDDAEFVRSVLASGQFKGPILELGVGYGGETCRSLAKSFGFDYFGTDLQPAPSVDFVADFETAQNLEVFDAVRPFGTLLILNVLEHVFDPIRVLDNASALLRSGGTLVVVTPCLWPIHNYPIDCWRPLPDFWREYGKRRGFLVLDDWFQYISVGKVNAFRNLDSTLKFPRPRSSPFHYWYGRLLHRVLNTYGRTMASPSHLAIGVAMRRDDTQK
jgi:SAM-dependent methyltransferase